MELFLLYCWLKLDSILMMLWISLFITAIVLIFATAHRMDISEDENPEAVLFRKQHTKAYKSWFALALFALLLPNSTNVAVLVAGSYAIDFVKSPEGTKVSALIRGKANEILDAELKKLTPQPGK